MVDRWLKKHSKKISILLPSPLVGEVAHSLKSLAGFNEVPVTNMYEALRGRIGDNVIIVYKSGSVVYESPLENVRRVIENALYNYYKGENILVGSDEAGKGEALGPLVVAATALSPKQAAYLQSIGVADSKIVPENRIPELANEIKINSLAYSLLKITPLKLNKMFEMKNKYGNLNDILARGHGRVLGKVISKIPEKSFKIIVDKFDSSKSERRVKTIEEALGGRRIQMITGGEIFPAVAAASVLAKASYLIWVRRNLSKDILKRIKEGDLSIFPVEKIPFYFKVSYLGSRYH